MHLDPRNGKLALLFIRPMHSHHGCMWIPSVDPRNGIGKTHITFHTSNAFTPGACSFRVWIQETENSLYFSYVNTFTPGACGSPVWIHWKLALLFIRPMHSHQVHVTPWCGSKKRKTHVTFHTFNAFTPGACGSRVWIQETENPRYFSYVQCIHTRCMWLPGVDPRNGKPTLLFISSMHSHQVHVDLGNGKLGQIHFYSSSGL